MEKLLQAGAKVFVVDKDRDAIARLTKEHPEVTAVAVDLRFTHFLVSVHFKQFVILTSEIDVNNLSFNENFFMNFCKRFWLI